MCKSNSHFLSLHYLTAAISISINVRQCKRIIHEQYSQVFIATDIAYCWELMTSDLWGDEAWQKGGKRKPGLFTYYSYHIS
jgi:hypothetical protein